MTEYIPYIAQMGYKLASDYMKGANQDMGQRTSYAGRTVRGRKKYNLRKILNSQLSIQEQNLGIQNYTTGAFLNKHMVSEYNLNGGYTSIGKATAYKELPMHVYDLSHVVGELADNSTNYPATGNSTAQCDDVNARAWLWTTDNKFTGLVNIASTLIPRWYINYPRTKALTGKDPEKIFMNSINIDIMAYGANKQPQTLDFMVIKITDPTKCPDYPCDLKDSGLTTNVDNTSLREFQYAWAKLINGWCTHPMLKNEPGPSMPPWFKIVARKKFQLGERTSLDTVPNARGSIKVNVNEVHNHCWSLKDFDDLPKTAAQYDNPPNVNDSAENNNWKSKPYYTSRYYLVVRAMGTIDTTFSADSGLNADANTVLLPYQDAEYGTNQPQDPVADTPLLDGIYVAGTAQLPKFMGIGVTATEYNASYDLKISTKYTKVVGYSSGSIN